jgi:adenylate kinase
LVAGSGRGTQAALLAKEFGLNSLASGLALRDHVARDTAVGRRVKSFLDHGEFVPDELVSRAVLPLLSDVDGLVLRGYPRTPEQVLSLQQFGIIVDAVIVLDVPDWELAERSVMSKVDPTTGQTYHSLKDEKLITADIQSRLVCHPFEANVEERIALYRQHSAAVCAQFPASILHYIDGDRHESEVGDAFYASLVSVIFFIVVTVPAKICAGFQRRESGTHRWKCCRQHD